MLQVLVVHSLRSVTKPINQNTFLLCKLFGNAAHADGEDDSYGDDDY